MHLSKPLFGILLVAMALAAPLILAQSNDTSSQPTFLSDDEAKRLSRTVPSSAPGEISLKEFYRLTEPATRNLGLIDRLQLLEVEVQLLKREVEELKRTLATLRTAGIPGIGEVLTDEEFTRRYGTPPSTAPAPAVSMSHRPTEAEVDALRAHAARTPAATVTRPPWELYWKTPSAQTVFTDEEVAGSAISRDRPNVATITPARPTKALQAPRLAVSIYAGEGDTHWIKSVGSDGEIIVLDDGSTWRVDSVDRVDTALWLPMEDVLVKDEGGGEYLLVNKDDAEKATAEYLGGD